MFQHVLYFYQNVRKKICATISKQFVIINIRIKKKNFKVFKHNIFSVFHFLSFYNFHCIYSNKALLVLLTIPYYPTLNSVTQSCPTLRPHGLQASLSITNSRSLLQLMFIKSVMPSNHLILCRPLLLLPSIFPSIRVLLAHD